MKLSFTSHARRLAGVTCRSLGWRPDDFWCATPAEIATIFAREGGEDDGMLSRGDFQALMERDQNG